VHEANQSFSIKCKRVIEQILSVFHDQSFTQPVKGILINLSRAIEGMNDFKNSLQE